MTEQEAKEKWCPMVRVSTYSPHSSAESSINRLENGNPYDGCLCIASACMMWREIKQTKTTSKFDETMFPIFETKIVGGYCGLADKP